MSPNLWLESIRPEWAFTFHRWPWQPVKASRLKNEARAPWEHFGREASSGRVCLLLFYVTCRSSLKDVSIIIVLHIYCVWYRCMRGRGRERERAMTYVWLSEDYAGCQSSQCFHLASDKVSFQLQMPGFLTHKPLGSSYPCLPSYCKSAEISDLHYQVLGVQTQVLTLVQDFIYWDIPSAP